MNYVKSKFHCYRSSIFSHLNTPCSISGLSGLPLHKGLPTYPAAAGKNAFDRKSHQTTKRLLKKARGKVSKRKVRNGNKAQSENWRQKPPTFAG